MLIAVFLNPESVKNLPRIEALVDGFELRLNTSYVELKKIRDKITKPIIIKANNNCMELGKLNPEYIDFDYKITNNFITCFHLEYPDIKIIRSYHDFECTPDDLAEILQKMQHPNCTVYKIVTYANNSLDSLKMLHFVKKYGQEYDLVAHCMGELGVVSRIVGSILGNYFHYAGIDLDNIPAPGCLDLNELINVYRIKKINQKTAVYALLGSPVEQSVGHIFHNDMFEKLGKNAVYIKIKLEPKELKGFRHAIVGLPFQGFSVTMPLKELIIPDSVVNTIRINNNNWSAINTDGVGALAALAAVCDITKSRLLVLGAGGAAKAIVNEAVKRKVLAITIVNRTASKAKDLAKQFNCLSELGDAYDIIINTIPADINKYIKNYLTDNLVFMDINYYSNHNKQIKMTNWRVVSGYDMYVNQALRQLDYWGHGVTR